MKLKEKIIKNNLKKGYKFICQTCKSDYKTEITLWKTNYKF
jgi:hypothetical protein